MYEDFFNETYKSAVSLLTNVSSDATVEMYLKRVVTSSMINVLKDSGRLRRTTGGYKATPTISLDAVVDDYNSEFSTKNILFKNVEFEENPENQQTEIQE